MGAAFALGASPAAALIPSSTPMGEWTVVGGQVSAVARSGNALYLGGAFQGLARRAPGIAVFNPDTGELEGPTVKLEQLTTEPIRVTATTAAADGGVYVAGIFVGAGGVRQQRLLRFTATGALDRAFTPDVQGATEIVDMDVGPDNGVLYLAGTLATVGGQPRSSLAAVDGATGALKAWRPAITGQVHQLDAGPAAVYLGGEFSQVGGLARARAAAVGPVDGETLAWRPETNGTVLSLALDGSTVYLGGDFTQVGGTDRFRLAAVAADGAGSLQAWNPAPSGSVSRIALSASRIYVAGSFQRIGSQAPQAARRFVAAIDKASGEALAWDPLANRRPSDLTVHEGRVFLAWKGGDVLPRLADQYRCGLASVDAQTGQPTPWNPSVEAAETRSQNCDPAFYVSGVDAITIAGGRVWAGGLFGVANIRRRLGLAALDATTGVPLAWAPTLTDVSAEVVQDLLPSPDGATIYVGGRFGRINGQTRRNAAEIATAGAADTPAALTNWDPAPDNASATGVVRALALSPGGEFVYLGGNFVKAGSPSRDRTNLAAVDTNLGAAQVWRPNPGGGNVRDLLVEPSAGRLFVAGSFTTITASSIAAVPPPADRVSRIGLAAIDIRTTPDAPTVTTWDAGLASGAEVEAVALRGPEILVGGQFAAPGAGPANLAAFDLATAALGSWNPQIDRRVSTVTVDPADGTAYITGAFTTAGGEPRSGAAAVGTDGAATGWDPAPSENYPATTVDATPPGGVVLLDDRLLLTGLFTVVGSRRQGGLAFFGPATAPVAVTPPRVTGTAKIGEPPLTCAAAAWAGDRGTLTIAWLRDDLVIAGQAKRTYRLGAADRGRVLRCRETMTNAAASVEQVSEPTAPVAGLPPALESPPSVGGQPWPGGTAQCTTGLWRHAPTDYRYQWAVAGAAIDGATSAGFAVSGSEQGRELTCEVTASNTDGVSPAARSAGVVVTEAPPVALGTPLISGDARVGAALTCLTGPWERARGFSYQWLRDRVPIVDALSPTLVATSRDLGRALTCLVTAENAGGRVDLESAAVVVAASARSVGTGRRPNPAADEPAAAAPTVRAAGIVVRSVRLRAGSTLAVAVKTPAAGRIGVTVVRRAAGGTRAAAKPAALTRGSRTVGRATAATVALKLFTGGRRLLERAGRRGLAVSVRVSFRPAKRSIAASSAQKSATLRRVVTPKRP